jgi:hypothetical protein
MYLSMSSLSAPRLFRPGTTRAFAFAFSPPIALQLAHRPRYIHIPRREDNSATIIKEYQRGIRTVLANPKLDDAQKYRITKRLFALIDHRQADDECIDTARSS